MLAKLIGLCAGLALLCFFIESDLRRAHREALWQASLRERYGAPKRRFPALERFLYEAREAGVSLPALIGIAAFVFVVGALVVSWAEESASAGLVISLGGTLAGLVGYVRVRYRKRRSALFQAWLREAMPIAITTLRATGRLDSALEDAAALVRDRRLKAELQQLVAMWKGLHTVPEQAFGMAAERWGVEEIRQLARLTEEAVRYHADLAE
ncbi:MAG: hypothetical protein K6T30_04975, partial [Alicyclobacillus sp.]|nr:hypothetical protein [Alicyclobacillus sp.]